MTTAAVSQPAVETLESTGNWEKFKTGVVDGTKWLGRQISWFFSKIAEYAVAAWIWAKDNFFIPAGKMIAEGFDKFKEFVIEHKQASIAAAVGFALGMIVYGISSALCCSGKKSD